MGEEEAVQYRVGSVVERYRQKEMSYYTVEVLCVNGGLYDVRYHTVRGKDGRPITEEGVPGEELRPPYPSGLHQNLEPGCEVDFLCNGCWKRGSLDTIGKGCFKVTATATPTQTKQKRPSGHISNQRSIRQHREFIGGAWY